MKLNVPKITYSQIAVGMMLFFSYMYTMADIIFKNKIVMFGYLTVALIIALIPHLCINRIPVVLDNISLLWIGGLVLALLHNRRLQAGDYSAKMIFWFGMVLIMLLIRGLDSWIGLFKNGIVFFTVVHVFFAWLFKFVPPLFNIFCSMFGGDTRATMLMHYSRGYLLGITTHYSTLAIYLGNGAVVLWALYKEETVQKKKKKYLALFSVTLITLAMIGKRGMLIFAAISFGIYELLTKAKDLRKTLPIILKYAAIAAVVIGGLVIAAYTIMPQLMMTMTRFTEGTEGTDITSGRSRMWLLAVQQFLNHPFLGIGWFGYRDAYEAAWYHGSSYQKLDTHNVYLQLLCETGLFGFVLFMVTFILPLIFAIKVLRTAVFRMKDCTAFKYKEELAVGTILQVLFLLYCFTGNPLYDPQNYIIYFLSIAMTLNAHAKIRSLQ